MFRAAISKLQTQGITWLDIVYRTYDREAASITGSSGQHTLAADRLYTFQEWARPGMASRADYLGALMLVYFLGESDGLYCILEYRCILAKAHPHMVPSSCKRVWIASKARRSFPWLIDFSKSSLRMMFDQMSTTADS